MFMGVRSSVLSVRLDDISMVEQGTFNGITSLDM
jgi:hypothetical protein